MSDVGQEVNMLAVRAAFIRAVIARCAHLGPAVTIPLRCELLKVEAEWYAREQECEQQETRQ